MQIMKQILLVAITLISNSCAFQDGYLSPSFDQVIFAPIFADASQRNYTVNITPHAYRQRSFSKAEQLAIYSGWLYRHNNSYRKSVNQQIEKSFAVLCHLNTPALHKQVKARLDLLFLPSEPF